MKYPETRHDSAVDVYHGISVPDPFRWLENPDSDESRAWIAAQNEVTAAWLQGVNDQRTIRSRIEHLWNYERHGLPQYKQGLYFFTHNHGLQNQAILYVTSDLEGEPRVLLDPNTLSQDGTRALADFAPSNDVKYLAYSVADAGSDWNSWYVRDIASGTDLDDRLAWVKFSRVAWSHDSAGFFYCRYGAPEVELQDINVNQCVWYHRVGTPQSDDILIFEYPDDPQWLFDVKVTDDGETLVLTIWIGTEDKSRIYLIELAKLDLEDTGAHTHISPVRLLDEFDAQYHHIGNDGPIHWFFTTHQAPRGRVIAIDRRTPEAANWHELIAQHRTDTIDSVSHIGGRFIVQYLCNAHTRVAIH